jgi:hypothetical protein
VRIATFDNRERIKEPTREKRFEFAFNDDNQRIIASGT